MKITSHPPSKKRSERHNEGKTGCEQTYNWMTQIKKYYAGYYIEHYMHVLEPLSVETAIKYDAKFFPHKYILRGNIQNWLM